MASAQNFGQLKKGFLRKNTIGMVKQVRQHETRRKQNFPLLACGHFT